MIGSQLNWSDQRARSEYQNHDPRKDLPMLKSLLNLEKNSNEAYDS